MEGRKGGIMKGGEGGDRDRRERGRCEKVPYSALEQDRLLEALLADGAGVAALHYLLLGGGGPIHLQ